MSQRPARNKPAVTDAAGDGISVVRTVVAALCVAVGIAWMVVYIRELRHMLPFTILVIPLAVSELERVTSTRAGTSGR